MSILGSDGTLRLSVDKDTEGAKHREYETSDGRKGEKWELIFKALEGTISNIQIYEGDYGKNLMVTLAYDGGADTISIGTSTPFGEDFLKKLPNIDLEKPIHFAPYSFTDDKGKIRKGVTIKQDGVKVENFFYDSEKKKNLHKFPEPEGDTATYDSDDWKVHFTKVRKFLLAYAEEHVMPKFAHLRPMIEVNTTPYPEMTDAPKF